MPLRPFIAAMLICVLAPAFAEQYAWPDLANPAGLQLNGTDVHEASVIRPICRDRVGTSSYTQSPAR